MTKHYNMGVVQITELEPYVHAATKPCLACRWLIKGNELEANDLWCDRCSHFHWGACPEIAPREALERPIIAGYCQCGCGRKTSLAPYNVQRNDYVRGQPVRFIRGHRLEKPKKPRVHGYVAAADPTWPTRRGRERYLHVQIVERALGHRLPRLAVVHHIDGNRTNNDPSNLVACQDAAYHNLLHVRQRALAASGNANYRKCCYCHRWDDPTRLQLFESSSSWRHRECQMPYKRGHFHRGPCPEVKR